MINIVDKSNCCGCTACEAACGRKAITMTPDCYGFKYPVVDENKCVKCSLCEKVCPFINSTNICDHLFQQKMFGCRLKDQEELKRSQSGGVFKAIADWTIDNGYVIYGVVLDENLEVRHMSASSKEVVQKFRGSKYVQSNLDGIFREIISKLSKKIHVLFIGTGCQVAGLISLCKRFKIDPEFLITVDLICYGVPSPKYWQDYLDYMSKKYGSRIVSANFRDKEAGGWRSARNSLTLDNGQKVYPEEYFYNSILFRDSCNKCPFTSFDRTSDITIGDFWGIERTHPEYAEDNLGISLMLVNSHKGANLVERIKHNLECFETSYDECQQQQLIHPNPAHPHKSMWEKEYAKNGYEKAIKKLRIYPRSNRARAIVARLIKILK